MMMGHPGLAKKRQEAKEKAEAEKTKPKEVTVLVRATSRSGRGRRRRKPKAKPKFKSRYPELAKITAVKKSHPGNHAMKHFDVNYFNSLTEDGKKGLLKCIKTGIENANSSMGCYAMRPADYDRFKPFFSKVLADYHNVADEPQHVNSWNLDDVDAKLLEQIPDDRKLDLSKLGLPALSMRVRVGRNLKSFPLPGAMTRQNRVDLESKMCAVFDRLKSMPEFGGRYHSLTPDHADFVTDEEYKELVA